MESRSVAATEPQAMESGASEQLGYRFSLVLIASAIVLAGLLLTPLIFAHVHEGLYLAGFMVPLGFERLLALEDALVLASAIAALVCAVGLWRKQLWAFAGITLVAAVCLAMIMVQLAMLGYHARRGFIALMTCVAMASLVLSHTPALRAYIGAKPVALWHEAVKWLLAAVVIVVSVVLFAGRYVSSASAAVRMQPYAELIRDMQPLRLPRCRWAESLRLCLPSAFTVHQSRRGVVIQRDDPDDAILLLSENVWRPIAARFGFTSSYDFQTTLWRTGYVPLTYALLKQQLYAPGMSVYQLQTARVKSLIQVQQQGKRWQVIATIYLSDGISFELMSMHRDRRKALNPVLVVVNAY